MKAINAFANASHAPIFVLSPARSGSTLLRFILDSHPDIACPPETNVGLACRYLVNTWRVLESGRRRHEATAIPDYILTATRAAVDAAFDHYLKGEGKSRWCDKTPNSCLDARLLSRLYPEAKFICLYRHCMDVIASGVEARPWGDGPQDRQAGFESDSFTAQYPGNTVAAGGAYWLSTVQQIMAFEESEPERCHRVRYEDMVTAPEEITAGIFSFLGVAQVPGITEECFRIRHEGNGPGDRKIWFTKKITTQSMGRGIAVPASRLSFRMREDINQLLEKLDYRTIDDSWNKIIGSIDPRAGIDGRLNADTHHSLGKPALHATVSKLTDRLSSWSDEELSIFRERWPFLSERDILLIVQDGSGDHQTLQWSFREGVALQPAAEPSLHEDEQDKCVTLIAAPDTWQAMLTGAANLHAEKQAFRLRQMRDIGWDELRAVGALLGLTPVPVSVGTADSLHGGSDRWPNGRDGSSGRAAGARMASSTA